MKAAWILVALILMGFGVGWVGATTVLLNFTNDSYAYRLTNGTWPQMRDGAGTGGGVMAGTSSAYIVSADTSNQFDSDQRSFLALTLPFYLNNTVIIDSVNISVKRDSVAASNMGYINMSLVDFTSATPKIHADSDYQATTFTRYSDDAPNTSFAFANIGWGNFSIYQSKLNKFNATGDLGLMITQSSDTDNVSPTWKSQVNSQTKIFSVSSTNYSYTPIAIITYHNFVKTDLYCMGDSTTEGNQTGDALSPTGSDSYCMQIKSKYAPAWNVENEMDGSGQTSTWFIQNFDQHYNKSMLNYTVMVGKNDAQNNINGTVTGINIAKLYNMVIANGTNCTILIPPLGPESNIWNLSNQNETIAQVYLTTAGLPFQTTWDAIDTVPYNHVKDHFNSTNYIDAFTPHPNKVGHTALADYIWCSWGSTCPTAITPTASFTTNWTSGNPPAVVQFTDTSSNTPTSWNWGWGDGTANGTTQNPVHTYTTPNNYTVFFNASNAAGYSTATTNLTIGFKPTASFTNDVNSTRAAPQTVNFTDTSTNTPSSWNWNFGDLTGNSTSQNPAHTFLANGTYHVALYTSNALGTSYVTNDVGIGTGASPTPTPTQGPQSKISTTSATTNLAGAMVVFSLVLIVISLLLIGIAIRGIINGENVTALLLVGICIFLVAAVVMITQYGIIGAILAGQ